MQAYLEKAGLEEGDKSKPYLCTKKKWTIGKGINLEVQDMPEEVVHEWQLYSPGLDILGKSPFIRAIILTDTGLPYTARQMWAEIILNKLVGKIEDKLHDEWDMSFGDLPKDCRVVLVDCCYQMGLDGFFAFKKTLTHIKNMDYVDASLELLDSKYARDDTPERAQRNSDLLMGCGCKL